MTASIISPQVESLMGGRHGTYVIRLEAAGSYVLLRFSGLDELSGFILQAIDAVEKEVLRRKG